MRDAWSAPWFEPYRGLLDELGDDALCGRWPAVAGRLNARAASTGLRNDNGRPVRFVDAAAAGNHAYEAHIWATGEVPTRAGEAGGWHDLFNACAWLVFPRTKAALNRLQARAIAVDGVGARRGGLRDAATLFDENAALLVTDDRALEAALRGFDWHALFVAGRERFARRARVVAFGHALVDKLRTPYKGVCAHAWIVDAPPDDVQAGRAVQADDRWARIDALAAESVDTLARAGAAFAPLPVLGIPGWWSQNEDPSFYADPAVFRAGRRARSRVPAAADN